MMKKKIFTSIFLFLAAFSVQAYQSDSVRLVLTQGTNISIDLSPDKQNLVMDLQGTIWKMPVKGGKLISLTDEMGDCRIPTWSPTGDKIAFHSYRDGNYHIWTVNVDGSQLKQHTFGMYDHREPVWSPDGKNFVFSSDRSGNYDLWKLEIVSGQLEQLTNNDANDYFPSFNADGSKLIFVSERSDAPGIYEMDSEGEEKLLAGSEAQLAGPVWHPKGDFLTYNALLGGTSKLEKVLLDQENVSVLSETGEDVFPFRISWLSDSEFLYTADGQIKKKNIDSGQLLTIDFEADISLAKNKYERRKYDFKSTADFPVKGIRSPMVSPDGKKIVFTALGDLWVLTKGNAVPEKVTDNPYLEIDPVWSPDGTQLAYLSDKNGNMNLYVTNLTNGTEKRLIEIDDDLKFPSWSPDGSKIAFYQAEGRLFSRRPIKLVNVEDGEITEAYEALFDGSRPSWSPANDQIMIAALKPNSTRFREGVSEFLSISLSGEADSYTAPSPGRTLASRGINGPVYSPDGNKVAYIMDGLLWIITVGSAGEFLGPPKRMVNELAEAPSWTGDSESIVFIATDQLKQVFLNDGRVESIPMEFTWKYHHPTESYVIHAGKVFDGKNNKYHENMDVVVEGNTIKEILPHVDRPNVTVIDASDKTLIPGLFEMHTHQDASAGEKLGRIWLSYGITTTREPGTDPYDVIERKEAWASGRRKGPRAFYTGGLMDGGRIYYGMAVGNSEAQLELELDRAKRLDYDMVKTYVRMSDHMQKRVTQYAHEIGIPVSSHEIYPAAKYGVDNVEHMGATSRRGYSPKLSALNYSYQDVIQIIAKSGMVITPTASLHGGYFSQIEKDPEFFNHWQFKEFYSQELIEETKISLSSRMMRNSAYLLAFPNVQKSVKAILDEGGRITPGTDSPIIPMGISLHAELQCWVDGGISTFETLRAATLWSAEALGVDDVLGTIESGKLADMVIIDGDPLGSIQDLLKVHAVISNGELFHPEDLKSLNKGNRRYFGFRTDGCCVATPY